MKPILIIGIPERHPSGTIEKARDALSKRSLKKDYHVLYHTYSGQDTKFELLSEKGGVKITPKELKKIIKKV